MEQLWEKRVIGGIVAGHIEPSSLPLDPSDFTDQELGQCLSIARRLEQEKLPVDAEILASRLAQSEGCFYSPRDLDLMALSASSASVVHDAVSKMRASALKSFVLQRAAELALKKESPGAALLAELREIVLSAEAGYRSTDGDFVWLSELREPVEAVYTDLFNGVSYAVPTYFAAIDRNLGDGFSKGDLHIVCGFTGQGKSALALNFARAQALNGHRVGIVSREMSAVENVLRLQATDSATPRWMVKRGMYERTYRELLENLGRLSSLPIAINTRTDSIEELRPQVARLASEGQVDVLYVDYLQLMHSQRRTGSRAEEVAAVSRNLKLIAMENRIPVVALCQFNRGAMNATKYDLLSYLKESSGIEQDASTILYVKFDKDDETAAVKRGTVTVLKNRNGASFQDIPVNYRGETFAFEEDPDRAVV